MVLKMILQTVTFSAQILSFKEILSNSIFWILTIIFTLQLTANLGVYTHIPIFSQDLGYSPLQASWIYSVAAFMLPWVK